MTVLNGSCFSSCSSARLILNVRSVRPRRSAVSAAQCTRLPMVSRSLASSR